jgi:hypothetical protein
MFKVTHRRVIPIGVATALVAAVLAVNPFGGLSGAAPITKTLQGTCGGADAGSAGLLAALGGQLTVPFQVIADVPPTLEPEQSGSPISFTWTVSLDASIASTVAAISPSLTVKNLMLDTKILGPTDTTEVQGRPADIVVNVVPGQPITISQGPFTGTLENVGKGGIIRYSPARISFTISLTISGQVTNVNIACQAPGTIATTAIKIPGSPDIDPISLPGPANSFVDVDVLGEYVRNGVDQNGEERPVDPSSLKVLDGPGTVVGGVVRVSTGDPNTTSSVTFEVCAGTLPGTNEVQRIRLDTSPDATKKSVGFTLKYGAAETDTIFTVAPMFPFTGLWGALIGVPATFQNPSNWVEEANGYIVTEFRLPAPKTIDDALERLPGIGAGGVEVTTVPGLPGAYDIEFTGQNGERDVDSIGLGSYYSVFPQEVLTGIIAAAQGLLGGGGGGGTTTTTVPIEQLRAQFDEALRIDLNVAPPKLPDFDRAGELLGQILQASVRGALANIDVQAVIQGLTSLFPKAPELSTEISGDAPIGICSQGVIDVTTPADVEGITTVPVSDVAGITTSTSGAGIRFTG